MAGGEAVLVGGAVEVGEDERADEAFQDFGRGAEEGDWAVGGAGFGRFVGLEDGEDDGAFPDGREVGVGDGEIEEGGEVGDTFGAEVFEVKGGETVRADGGRVFRSTDGVGGGSVGEGSVGGVERELMDLAVDAASLRILAMINGRRVLLVESLRNCLLLS